MMYAAGVCGLGALSECILQQRVKKEIAIAKAKAIKEYKTIGECEKDYRTGGCQHETNQNV